VVTAGSCGSEARWRCGSDGECQTSKNEKGKEEKEKESDSF
jgi:hypothetical protein